MPENKKPSTPEQSPDTAWWSPRLRSRALLQFLIGTDAASFALILFAGGLVYVITVQQDHGPLGSLIWLLGLLIVLHYLDKVVTQIIRLIETLRRQ